MKNDKDHLNIDLEFLDQKEPTRVAPTQSNPGQPATPTPVSTRYKFNWKNILIIGGIILFVGWLLFSDSSDSTTATSPSGSQTSISDESLNIGEYSCSRYHYDQAVALDPNPTEQQIDSERTALESRSNALERLGDEVDNSYVNEYSSQWEIDQHNENIDEYNSRLPAFKRDVANFESKVDEYNSQIERHNNYLEANCTK